MPYFILSPACLYWSIKKMIWSSFLHFHQDSPSYYIPSLVLSPVSINLLCDFWVKSFICCRKVNSNTNFHQCVLCVPRINKCVCPKLMRHSDILLIVLRQQWSSLAQGIKIPGFDYTLVHCCFCPFYGICWRQKTKRMGYHQTSA